MAPQTRHYLPTSTSEQNSSDSAARGLSCQLIDVDFAIDPLDVAGALACDFRFYLERPSQNFSLLAAFCAARFEASGKDRLLSLAHTLTPVLEALTPSIHPHVPLAVGGFAFFDDQSSSPLWRHFPPALMVVPKLTLINDGNKAKLLLIYRSSAELAELTSLARALVAQAKNQSLSAKSADARAQGNLASNLTEHPAPAPDNRNRHPYFPTPISNASHPIWAAAPKDRASAVSELERWRRRLESALSAIQAGSLRKVVLSRQKSISLVAPLNPVQLMGRLRRKRPQCTTFWLELKGKSFVGSTPELLVRRSGAYFESAAMAGSAPRANNETDERKLIERLYSSDKERHEHALVVEAIRSALLPLAAEIEIPSAPHLARFPEAFHLLTPITGKLKRPVHVLELAARLHPTPAVCGVPVERALAILRRDEAERGWYAGGIGWVDGRGDGEFVVALRSALLEHDRLTAFAGAGIVAGSEPEAEFAETEAKMGALLGEVLR